MVTFTIKNGQVVVGSPVGATVDATGSASTNFTLPAAFAIGTYTIQADFTDTGNFFGSSDATHSLTVTQPMPAKLAIFAQPSSGTAGKPFAPSLVIYEEDQFGDLEIGDNSTVVTASLATGNGPLLGTLTATVVGGIATFSNLYDDVAEIITLKFSSGNLTAGHVRQHRGQPGRRQQAGRDPAAKRLQVPVRRSQTSRSSRKKISSATSSPPTAPIR